MKEKVSPTQKVLNLWAIVLIVWSIYRAQFKTNLPIWFDELIMKPTLFILPVYYFVKKIEKSPDFFGFLNLRLKKSSKDILLGLAIGLVFFGAGLLGSFIKDKTFSQTFIKTILNFNFLLTIIISFATSISEEILSRGFVLNRLYKESKNIFSAIFISSILFFILHIPILLTSDKITGYLLLRVMLTDFMLSVIVSSMYLSRKNLLLPIIIHALYNLNIALFI